MYRKNYSAVRETQYGEGTGPATDGYKDRPYWESEGFICKGKQGKERKLSDEEHRKAV